MLAYREPVTPEQVRCPCFVQMKYDGIRVLDTGNQFVTRTWKAIPNTLIRSKLKLLSAALDINEIVNRVQIEFGQLKLDGELIIPGADFHHTQSVVMSEEHPDANSVQLMAFDLASNNQRLKTWDRHALLKSYYADVFRNFAPAMHINVVPNIRLALYNDGLKEWLIQNPIPETEEGYIIRYAYGVYKFGRSTLNEGLLLKYVDWVREDVEIIGTEELMRNLDTSCNKLENQVPGGTLGAFVCRSSRFNNTFNVGTGKGLTAERRAEFWAKRNTLPGQTLTIKYKKFGSTDDAPRSPQFVGIRKELT